MTTKIKRIVDEIWDIKTNITNKREESKIAFQKQRDMKNLEKNGDVRLEIKSYKRGRTSFITILR